MIYIEIIKNNNLITSAQNVNIFMYGKIFQKTFMHEKYPHLFDENGMGIDIPEIEILDMLAINDFIPVSSILYYRADFIN